MSQHQAHARADAVPRRTVTITGHPERTAPRHLRLVEVERRRPPRTAVERLEALPTAERTVEEQARYGG